MSHTHGICPHCWNAKNPDRLFAVSRDGNGAFERCCFCRFFHVSGLYVRHSSDGLTCSHGDHYDELVEKFVVDGVPFKGIELATFAETPPEGSTLDHKTCPNCQGVLGCRDCDFTGFVRVSESEAS